MEQFDLDTVLIEFAAKTGSSNWTIRDAVEGLGIFGGIGSGKSSGSARMVALKFLSNGFGGLVLTAKADEKDTWLEYCRLTGRLDDLVVIESGGQNFFNFLEYESSHKSDGTTLTGNLVQVLKTVIKAGEEKDGSKEDDAFWETALDLLIFNVIDLCMLAYGKVSIQEIFDIVTTAPKKKEAGTLKNTEEEEKRNAFSIAMQKAQKKVLEQIEDWKETLDMKELWFLEDKHLLEQALLDAVPDARKLSFIDQFFIENYRSVGEKTRAIIEFSFTGFLFRLMQEPFYSLFCRNKSTVTPDDCLEGKIILLNLPVKKYHKVGRDIQVMFKYLFQRSMEKRDVKLNGRPVFLFADEAQHFLHEYDSEYQATARSSRIATVYISQNLSNYHANMGGNKSEFRVKSLTGTFGWKVFHSNADFDTNKYASDLIGEAYVEDYTNTITSGERFSSSRGTAYKLEKMVRPEEFFSLRTGGPLNQFLVDGYIHRQGQSFQNGVNFQKVVFNQNFNP